MDRVIFEKITEKAYNCEYFEDVRVGKSAQCPLILLNSGAIYLFVESEKNFVKESDKKSRMKWNESVDFIKNIFKLPTEYVYFFLVTPEQEFYLLNKKNELFFIERIEKTFFNLHEYHNLPLHEQLLLNYSEEQLINADIEKDVEDLYCRDIGGEDEREDTYVRTNFSEEQLENFRGTINQYDMSSCESDIYTDENGNRFIRKAATGRIGNDFLHIDFFDDKKWYPLSDEDSDQKFFTTFLFGLFGAHKLSEQNLASCIFYFLTGGSFLFGYLFDLLRLLTGNYYSYQVTYEGTKWKEYKQIKRKYYYAPMEHKKIGWILFFIAIPLSFLYFFFVYKRILIFAVSAFVKIVDLLGQSEKMVNESNNIMNFLK